MSLGLPDYEVASLSGWPWRGSPAPTHPCLPQSIGRTKVHQEVSLSSRGGSAVKTVCYSHREHSSIPNIRSGGTTAPSSISGDLTPLVPSGTTLTHASLHTYITNLFLKKISTNKLINELRVFHEHPGYGTPTFSCYFDSHGKHP